ncbi:MAG: DNA mismatch repair endonuclease MutL [Oscillospiraceae bacterium]|nr:DNA mismatch repair endonuclease MutL [Oscillospiraceae bacterium]
MAKVQVLSKETAELIAAGEVIERPSSIVKELIENSIDSGATAITVEIKHGGISYLRVTDNGCGIDHEDVPTAFLRHATSKIRDKSDLDSILTLGFRGEALASICAVAKVDVLTKTFNEQFGTHYSINGGIEKEYEQTGCPDGTTIIIRDIFYNVPARLKFLKKDVAEGNAIASIVDKIAISHPEISFKFIRDNKQEFVTPGDGELYSSVYAVMGKQFAASMLPVDYELNGIKINGFTVKPLFGRPNRTMQHFFINGRYVKSLVCTRSLEHAYQNSIMEGKFPSCVLMLTIPPSIIDVNVHPAKIEVRFTDERVIADSIFFAVKNAILLDSKPVEINIKKHVIDYRKPVQEELPEYTQIKFQSEPIVQEIKPVYQEPVQEHIVTPQPHIPVTPQIQKPIPTVNTVINNISDNKITDVPYDMPSEIKNDDLPLEKLEPVDDIQFKYISEASFEKKKQIQPEPKKEIYFKVIGEVFKNYIIAEVEGDIVFIDKHAAHERILFEKLKSGKQKLVCQMLLNSPEVILDFEEFNALIQNKDFVSEMGFEFEISGSSKVIVSGVPTILDQCDPSDLIIELARNLSDNKANPMPEILDDMYHTFACKAAIKANDVNTLSELAVIVKTILTDESIRYCPHGRPVMFKLTKRELEKQFKRIV